jgi:hypothetical protein
MPKFGEEYSSDSAYFIAGGRTLEIIKKLEDDFNNKEALLDAIANKYGANKLTDTGVHIFEADHEVTDPALKFEPDFSNDAQKDFFYTVNEETPEGRALQERLDDIPYFSHDNKIFARRLTGTQYVAVNPDKLQEPGTYSTDFGNRGENAAAASYRKLGDAYVVKVPRTIRGIFNEASEKESIRGAKRFAGYYYEWFTPPDSQPVPYSKVIELKEKQLGDQTKPRQVNIKLGSQTPYPRP